VMGSFQCVWALASMTAFWVKAMKRKVRSVSCARQSRGPVVYWEVQAYMAVGTPVGPKAPAWEKGGEIVAKLARTGR